MFLERVEAFITKNQLISDGDTIIIGFSGGPDSLCLVHVLERLAGRHRWRLVLAHFDHQLRDDASRADAAFCRAWAESRGLQFYEAAQDIAGEARRRGESTELAARRCRYAFFRQLQAEIGAQRIALGHHRDDQAETVLMRLIRGTGTDGIAGMRPLRPDGVVRPLLAESRDAILKYCETQGLDPRYDHTNMENLYTRNSLRLEVLPLLAERYNPKVAEALCRAADIAAEDSDCLNRLAEENLTAWVKATEAGLELPLERLAEAPPAIRRRLVRQAVRRIAGTARDLESEHVDQVLKISAQGQAGKLVVFCGVRFTVGYGTLIMASEQAMTQGGIQDTELELPLADGAYEAFGGRITIRTFPIGGWEGDTQRRPGCIVIDADALNGPLRVRKRQVGDRMMPLGMAQMKKVKNIFIDRKIPRSLRDSIPVFCDGEKIVWLAGVQMDERVRVTSTSQRLAEICWEVCCSPDGNVLE